MSDPKCCPFGLGVTQIKSFLDIVKKKKIKSSIMVFEQDKEFMRAWFLDGGYIETIKGEIPDE